MKNQAFTLIELLVVVLIIGILAAIAVPQYQKAVLKSNLHKGIFLLESFYQAQQSYFLTNGKFANNLTELDVSLPVTCGEDLLSSKSAYKYRCDFGILYTNNLKNIYFETPDAELTYIKYLEDYYNDSINYTFKAGHRYCNARPTNKTANDVCVNMGGKFIKEREGVWTYYSLD